MKKIMILIALVCGVTLAQAQTWNSLPMTFSVSGDDTATNADQILLHVASGLSGKYDVNVKLTSTKVSGTVGGTAYCQGSDDNTNWFTLKVASTVSPSVTDTAMLANATTVYSFVYPSVPYKYFRVVYNTTGTQVSAPTATIYYRKAY
jgi:hypothetical protein